MSNEPGPINLSMSDHDQLMICLIYLLQQEVIALRSVLSEWDHDKSCYVQFHRADACRTAVEVLEHSL